MTLFQSGASSWSFATVIEQYVQASADSAERAKAGRATSMRCACGGTLHEDAYAYERAQALAESVLARPRHRKRRILKKRLKAWKRRIALFALVSLAKAHPNFICATCGRRSGLYAALARNLIQVETLPQGALPIYDRDPGGPHDL